MDYIVMGSLDYADFRGFMRSLEEEIHRSMFYRHKSANFFFDQAQIYVL